MQESTMNDSINLSTFIDEGGLNQNDCDSYNLTDLLYMQAMKAKEEYPAQVTLHISDFDTDGRSR